MSTIEETKEMKIGGAPRVSWGLSPEIGGAPRNSCKISLFAF